MVTSFRDRDEGGGPPGSRSNVDLEQSRSDGAVEPHWRHVPKQDKAPAVVGGLLESLRGD
jgi:hypothetical protein